MQRKKNNTKWAENGPRLSIVCILFLKTFQGSSLLPSSERLENTVSGYTSMPLYKENSLFICLFMCSWRFCGQKYPNKIHEKKRNAMGYMVSECTVCILFFKFFPRVSPRPPRAKVNSITLKTLLQYRC